MTRPNDNPRPIATMLSRVGLVVMLISAFLRATVGFEPMPGWDLDPTVVDAPSAGLRPAELLILDTLVFAAAAFVLLGEALRGRGINLTWCVLAVIGCVGVGLHALAIHGGSLDDLRIGSGWAAAIVGGLAAAHACRDPGVRIFTLAALIGFVGLIAAKGTVQFTFEHDLTVETFEANREAIFQARGWLEDSAAARAYEHRLRQREATGWFALANAVASVAAATFVALVGWGIIAARDARSSVRRLPNGFAALIVIGAVIAAALVAMAGAKGGFAAATLGLLLLACGWIHKARCRSAVLTSTKPHDASEAAQALNQSVPFRRLYEAGPWIVAAGILVFPILAIVLRGVIGERIGELSLLFRWFYISTATRIFVENPMLGVGPSGFQRAYMLLKPAISPEDVQSPHSLTFDYLATLGVFGMAWIGLVLMWLAGVARHVLAPLPVERRSGRSGPGIPSLLVVVIVPLVIGVMLETPAQNLFEFLLSLITRGVGLLAWIGIAAGILALLRERPEATWCIAPAAIALAAHGQVEMTPIWTGSGAWFMLVLAAAGAPEVGQDDRRARFVPSVVLAMAAVGMAALIVPRVITWQASLLRAASLVRPIQEFESRRAALELGRTDPRFPGDSWPRFVGDLARRTNSEPARSPNDMIEQLAALRAAVAMSAMTEFVFTASPAFPTHTRTMTEASRLALSILVHLHQDRAPTQERLWAHEGLELALAYEAATSPEAGASEWVWLATVCLTRHAHTGREDLLRQGLEALQRAAELDPHGLPIRLRLMDTYLGLGNLEEAARWARETLIANEKARLDPRKVLSETELERVRRVAGGS